MKRRGPIFGPGEPIPELPSRAQELLTALRYSLNEQLYGRIGILEAAKERRLILAEAREAGVLDEVMRLMQKDSGGE